MPSGCNGETKMEANTGIQVLISSYNCEEYLESCFDSIEVALSDYKWMMIFCDDGSTDDTEAIVNNYSLSNDTNCKAVVYQKFEKASVVGAAKNKACSLALQHKAQYPVICFMDSDDTMGAERISGLLPELSEEYPIVFGDYVEQEQNENGEWVKMEKVEGDDSTFDGYIPVSTRTTHLTFGPWSTLILASLIPEDGRFFREDIANYDDLLTWWTLHYRDGVGIKAVPGFITHYQKYGRAGSLNDVVDERAVMLELYEKKTAIHPVPAFTYPYGEEP